MHQKKQIIDLIIATLKSDIQALTESAQAAHQAATHEESKAEDSHDTRGLEASYLAGAQRARLESLKKDLAYFQLTEFRNHPPHAPINIGALIELKDENHQKFFCFLVHHKGGLNLSVNGIKIQTVTPQSPLGEAILDRSAGESIEIETPTGDTRVYSILSTQ